MCQEEPDAVLFVQLKRGSCPGVFCKKCVLKNFHSNSGVKTAFYITPPVAASPWYLEYQWLTLNNSVKRSFLKTASSLRINPETISKKVSI